MARKYEKKSPFWGLKSQAAQQAAQPINPEKVTDIVTPDLNYEFTGGEHFTEIAACGGGNASIEYRGQYVNSPVGSIGSLHRYENIRQGLLPYEASGGNVTVSEAIELCQRAYANVAIFKNTIDIMTEFSTAELYVRGGNKASKDFVKAWFERVDIASLAEQFFREWYRSGNVFIYRFDGTINNRDLKTIKEVLGSEAKVIPVQYVILNPTTVAVESGIGYNGTYVKMLSTYEIERLRNPKTDEEKAIFEALPQDVKEQLKKRTSSYRQLYIPIDKTKLHTAFYKKQSYENLAIPMGFPVLNDIEWKLSIKKMDMALSRTIENAILLITNGAEPDKGGINKNNITKLQEIFKNQTIGRVLVADFTTKGEWLIPDIQELLGPEKYQVVNQDIREGLQLILAGEEKFANSQMKIKIFIERLKEGQKAFLRHFLMPELKRLAKEFNLKSLPRVGFEPLNFKDEVQINRIYLRLAELGLIDPEELFTALETGVLPDKDENLERQKSYKKNRDDGFYYPLVGGSKPTDEAGGRPTGKGGTRSASPIGSARGSFSAKALAENLNRSEQLKEIATASFKKKFKVKTFSEEQLSVIDTLVKNVIANEEPSTWNEKVVEYANSPKEMDKSVANEIDEICLNYETDSMTAVLLYRSQIPCNNK